MKTASRVLGIIGGALSIIIALFCLLIVLNVNADWEYHFGDSTPMSVSYCSDSVDPNANDTELTALLVILVLPGILCGGMGIFGGIIVPKRSTAAGVMFIISAVLGLLFFITTICFILAAIFAFIKEKPRMPYYPYYPYYPYPPASPYGYTPYGTPYHAALRHAVLSRAALRPAAATLPAAALPVADADTSRSPER